jgi:hypothetical protein
VITSEPGHARVYGAGDSIAVNGQTAGICLCGDAGTV